MYRHRGSFEVLSVDDCECLEIIIGRGESTGARSERLGETHQYPHTIKKFGRSEGKNFQGLMSASTRCMNTRSKGMNDKEADQTKEHWQCNQRTLAPQSEARGVRGVRRRSLTATLSLLGMVV